MLLVTSTARTNLGVQRSWKAGPSHRSATNRSTHREGQDNPTTASAWRYRAAWIDLAHCPAVNVDRQCGLHLDGRLRSRDQRGGLSLAARIRTASSCTCLAVDSVAAPA